MLKNTFKYFFVICVVFISKTKCLEIKEDKSNFLKVHDKSVGNRQLQEYLPKNLPCPEAADILPCSCSVDESYYMVMDCSDVKSETELRGVFNQTFPFEDFDELRIVYNSNLDSLTDGVFGLATFVEIYIDSVSSLSSVGSTIFNNMKDTLEKLTLGYCNLDRFEFNFESFSSLYSIDLYSNDISTFDLNLPTVNSLNLGYNKLNQSNFHPNVPNLQFLDLYENQFTRVPNISSYNKLIDLHLYGNLIQNVFENEICNSDYLDRVDLNSNGISSIEPNSICVKNESYVHLWGNQIATIDEAVFQPIAINVWDGGLGFYANPLLCGCDIAWLFYNDYMDKININTACTDGENIHDLDPALYEAMCFN